MASIEGQNVKVNVVPIAERPKKDTLVLFDVDGTLTPARLAISKEMLQTLEDLREKTVIGFVGGSNLAKQKEQIGENVVDLFDWAFAENGLTAYQNGIKLDSQSFIKWIGEDKYKELVRFILHYMADLELPIKRGTFIEYRNGMINVSPIGRNASTSERNDFEAYDKQHGVRQTLIEKLKEKFDDSLDLKYSIGGQISFDVFPTGWDKTYCLRHVEKEGYKHIHFFGDKMYEGGNDYEMTLDSRVTSHPVTCPEDTIKIVKDLFL